MTSLKELIENIAREYTGHYDLLEHTIVADVTEPDEPDPVFWGTFTQMLEWIQKDEPRIATDERFDAWLNDLDNNYVEIYICDHMLQKIWYGYATAKEEDEYYRKYRASR